MRIEKAIHSAGNFLATPAEIQIQSSKDEVQTLDTLVHMSIEMIVPPPHVLMMGGGHRATAGKNHNFA